MSTDKITAAEYRTAAKVADIHGRLADAVLYEKKARLFDHDEAALDAARVSPTPEFFAAVDALVERVDSMNVWSSVAAAVKAADPRSKVAEEVDARLREDVLAYVHEREQQQHCDGSMLRNTRVLAAMARKLWPEFFVEGL